jgi:redox-sensitive bicupin YhaK (pirin superfamily)
VRIADLKNRLRAVASSDPDHRDAVSLNTDAAIYLADTHEGHEHRFDNSKGRRLFLYVTSGALEVNGTRLEQNDQGRIEDEPVLNVRAVRPTRFIIVEVP